MQLVAMVPVALLVLVRADKNCKDTCQMIPTEITLEECGNASINTTICAGLCFLEAKINKGSSKQKICNGEWSYEVAAIDGCPVGVTYPVATKCWCTTCDRNTDCLPKSSAIYEASCLAS